MIATEPITITLIHSVGGLLAEIELPILGGPDWETHPRTSEMAFEALRVRYPQLRVVRSEVENGRVLAWLEAL